MNCSLSRILLLLLILLAFAWRIHSLDTQSLWRDEVDAIFFATRPLPEAVAMFMQRAQNGPLYFLTLRPWFRIVGTTEFALRFPSVLAGTLSIPLLYQITRRLLPAIELSGPFSQGGERRGGGAEEQAILEPLSLYHLQSSAFLPLLAATFLAINPYQLWYSQEGKMYAMIVCLTLAITCCWLQGISKGGWKPWLAYFLLTSASIYTHLLMVLIIPLHVVWFLIAWPQSKRYWRGYGAALAGLTLPYLPMLWWQWEMLISTEKATGFHFTPIPQMLRILLLNHGRGFMPPGDLIWLTPLFFLGLAGLLMGWLEVRQVPAAPFIHLPGWRRYMLVVSWLIVPTLGIYAMSLRQPIFTDRYIIWIAPAAMMLLALGVRVVMRNGAILGRPLALLLVVYLCGFWFYAGWQQKVTTIKYDLRAGVHYVAERRTLDELLILQIPHMEWSYRYYSSTQGTHPFDGGDERLGHWERGLWTNNGFADEKARADVDATMQQATSGVHSVWVLYSEVEMWDARHLMRQWLEQHATVTDEAFFHGVQVKRYELRQ